MAQYSKADTVAETSHSSTPRMATKRPRMNITTVVSTPKLHFITSPSTLKPEITPKHIRGPPPLLHVPMEVTSTPTSKDVANKIYESVTVTNDKRPSHVPWANQLDETLNIGNVIPQSDTKTANHFIQPNTTAMTTQAKTTVMSCNLIQPKTTIMDYNSSNSKLCIEGKMDTDTIPEDNYVGGAPDGTTAGPHISHDSATIIRG